MFISQQKRIFEKIMETRSGSVSLAPDIEYGVLEANAKLDEPISRMITELSSS